MAGYNIGELTQLKITYSLLAGQAKDIVFAVISPLLIAAGITSVIATMIPAPIIEIQGPIRSYMESCSLHIFPYWIVMFIFDFIIWIIDITLVWALFVICDIKIFSDNMGMSYYILLICGPSFILYIYCISFFFSDPVKRRELLPRHGSHPCHESRIHHRNILLPPPSARGICPFSP